MTLTPENYGLVGCRRTGHFLLFFTVVSVALGTVSYAQQVATPTFTPNGGWFATEQVVSVNCATSDATIYHTTDGIIDIAGGMA